MKEEIEGGVNADGDEKAFEYGFLAEAFAEWEVEDFCDEFGEVADAMAEFFVMGHDDGVFTNAVVVAEDAGEN